MRSFTLSVLSGIVALTTAAEVNDTYAAPAVLKPLNKAVFNAITGGQAEPDAGLGSLVPADYVQFAYGSPQTESSIMVANMTVFSENGLPILLLEDSDRHTNKVECDEHEGKITVGFNSRNAYQYALDNWKYLNADETMSILLVANHDGCGPHDQRQPYIVSSVDQNGKALEIYLKAAPTHWNDAAPSYDLDFGEFLITTDSRGLEVRRNKSGGNFFSLGTENKPINLYKNGNLNVDLANCFLSGTFVFTGSFSMKRLSIKKFTITVNAHGVRGALVARVSYNVPGPSSTAAQTFPIVSDIPLAGFTIDDVFTFAALAGLKAGWGFSASSDKLISLSLGLKMTLPDNANIVVNFKDLGSSSASNFDPVVQEVASVDYAVISSLNANMFLQPSIAATASVGGLGSVKAEVDFKLPKISATSTLDAAHRQLSIAAAAEMIIDLVLSGKITGLFNKNWSKQLYDHPWWSKTFVYPF